MNVLITGANGQLGWELLRTAPTNYIVQAMTRNQLDLLDLTAIPTAIESFRPDVIINAAGYTAVDGAESERDLAFRINADAVGEIARCARACGSRLIHLSTDYVFDGRQSQPYRPDAAPNPLNVYGASKRAGELAILEHETDAVILRTAWVYSSHGHNFVKTMLRLMREKPQLSVVADQIGTPTWAHHLADAIWRFVTRSTLRGIFHFTDAGVASWYDFAVAILEEAQARGLMTSAVMIRPITTTEYPLPAARPFYSVLDKRDTWHALEWEPRHWRLGLRAMFAEL